MKSRLRFQSLLKLLNHLQNLHKHPISIAVKFVFADTLCNTAFCCRVALQGSNALQRWRVALQGSTDKNVWSGLGGVHH